MVAGWLAGRAVADVSIYSEHAEKWNDSLTLFLPDGTTLDGRIDKVSSDPAIVRDSDCVLLCYPGFKIRDALLKIRPHLKKDCYVGTVFSSTGFFFEAPNILPESQPLWGFQRVPFISRVREYGRSASLLGFKPSLDIAVERVDNTAKEAFAAELSRMFDRPVHLLSNYYEASLSNSNPILHPARLYDLFGGENEGKIRPRMVYFYEEWTEHAAQLLIDMDKELFDVLETLPVRKGFLPRILDYYESSDAASLAAKLRSIPAFKGIPAPMVQTEDGWIADWSSRYFTEDFPYGLRYICLLARKNNVEVPLLESILQWGEEKIMQR